MGIANRLAIHMDVDQIVYCYIEKYVGDSMVSATGFR